MVSFESSLLTGEARRFSANLPSYVDDPLHLKGAFAPAGRIPVRTLTPTHEGLGYAAQLMVPAFQPRVPRSRGDANLAADNPALLEKRRHLKTSMWHTDQTLFCNSWAVLEQLR